MERKKAARKAVKPPAGLRGHALPRGEWECMTLEEWRSNSSCVQYTEALLKEPLFRRLLGMLHGFASEPQPQNDSEGIRLGRVEGMRLILRVMLVAGIPIHTEDEPMAYEHVDEEGII